MTQEERWNTDGSWFYGSLQSKAAKPSERLTVLAKVSE